MASTSTTRPSSYLQPPVTLSIVDQISPSLRPRTRPTSHYRPFSSIYSEAPSENPPLATKQRPRSVSRPCSSSGIPSLVSMGFRLKDKTREKELARARTLSDLTATRPPSPSRPIPPLPINAERPSCSHGRFTLNRVKKKSLVSILSAEATTAQPSTSSPTPDMRSSPLVNEVSFMSYPIEETADASKVQDEEDEEDDYGDTDKYVRKNIWVTRHNTKLHPYGSDAPYMQSYDPILLSNDRHTNTLLRRLNTTGSPSFHDYGRKPPSSALDLGCGQGHWVLEAANAWRQTQITGFDLINVTLTALDKMDNVQFVRGNFLKYHLPFADKTFELVRVANLSLCIPYDKWEFVLSEAQRVLTIDGRLELIDDQIFFPYGQTPTPESTPVSPSTPVDRPRRVSSLVDLDDLSDESDDNEDSTDEDGSLDTVSTLIGDCDTYGKLKTVLVHDVPRQPDPPLSSAPLSPANPDTPTPNTTASTDTAATMRPSPWGHRAAGAHDLETVFEDMLNKKFGIHPRPSEFVLDLMTQVFGRGNAIKMRSLHLKLAPRNTSNVYGGYMESGSDKEDRGSANSSESSLVGGKVEKEKKPWLTIEWDKKEKGESKVKIEPNSRTSGEGFVTSAQVPERISAKAAGRLGISYSALAAATVASSRPRLSSSSLPSTPLNPTQTPGLILWPTTFIPLSPSELEMHACKHVHTLLGCKAALADYIEEFKDENGARFVEDDEFQESVWDYECFRRQRFHWPSEVPESNLDSTSTDSISPKSVSARMSPSFNLSISAPSISSPESTPSGPYSRDELTHIRTIRVYEAIKTTDFSLSTMLFPRPPPVPPSTH